MSDKMEMGKIKSILFWAILICIDSIIAIGVAEIWGRLFVPVKNVGYFVDEKIGVRYCPYQRTYGHVEQGYCNILLTNSLGFHDIERSREKRPGIFRVHVYGDSMIAGLGVQIKDTIPSQLEKEINKNSVLGEFEILNMASGSESTGAQLITYEEIGIQFDHDLVICFFMDDFGDNVLELSGNQHAPYFSLNSDLSLLYCPPVPKNTSSFFYKLRTKSAVYNLLKQKILESKAYHNVKHYIKQLSYLVMQRIDPPTHKKNYEEIRKEIYINLSWPLTLRLIKEFRDKVKRNGAEFILVDGREFDENVGTIYKNRDLENYCIKNGIHYIPAYQVMNKLRYSEKLRGFFFEDNHLNQLGNKIMSQFLSEKIKEILHSNLMLASIKRESTIVGRGQSNNVQY